MSQPEIAEAVKQVREWGYPRPLEPIDTHENTYWLGFGPDVLIWYYLSPDKLFTFHVVRNPSTPSSMQAKRLWHGIRFLAEISNADYIVLRSRDPQLEGYFRRLGFRQDDGTLLSEPGWWVFEL